MAFYTREGAKVCQCHILAPFISSCSSAKNMIISPAAAVSGSSIFNFMVAVCCVKDEPQIVHH